MTVRGVCVQCSLPFFTPVRTVSRRPSALDLPAPPPELAAISQRLGERIGTIIERDGPLPFERYMAMALYEPGLGYYMNGLHKFGSAGDFVTAPEQGRLFAIAVARQVDEVAARLADPWTVLELGAGSGALARDLLSALQNPPARYRILEPSAALREVQRATLADLPAGLGDRVEWIAAPPSEPFDGLILANEVMDALPVARFEIGPDGPMERCVAVRGDRLGWTVTAPRKRLGEALSTLRERLGYRLPEGYVSEVCLDLGGWLDTVSRPLRRGALLLVDYGYPRAEYYLPERSAGTLVCHYRHRAHFDPFVWPGLTDLSAFVDFSACAEAGTASGLELAGFTTQADFLLGMRIHELIDETDDEASRMRLAGEFKRLVMPGEMGEKFKVMAFTRGLTEPLVGLAESDRRQAL